MSSPASRRRRRGRRRLEQSGGREMSLAGVALVLVLAAGALVLWQLDATAGRGGGAKTVGMVHHGAGATPTEPSAEETTPGAPAPLTGVPTTSGLERPAVVVKISNTPAAHPHRGLGDADVVFVEPITGATTRLAAIFHSTLPAEVGPVRSLRPMDGPIAGPTRGVLANTMGQQWVVDHIDATADVANIGTLRVPRGTYHLDDTRTSPNHVFAQPDELITQSERTEPPAPFFHYADGVEGSSPQQDGSAASGVTIGYGGTSTATWTYDGQRERWLRSEDWSDHILENGEQVAADNVIVLRAARDLSFPQADADMTVLDLVDTSGSLQLLTGDAVIDGQWSKAGPNEPFEFTTEDGEPLLLAPGSTWVEMPLDTM
ncbi:MAG: DUF3048 domain-containing protein, partial [Jiangellaceae bacterium]